MNGGFKLLHIRRVFHVEVFGQSRKFKYMVTLELRHLFLQLVYGAFLLLKRHVFVIDHLLERLYGLLGSSGYGVLFFHSGLAEDLGLGHGALFHGCCWRCNGYRHVHGHVLPDFGQVLDLLIARGDCVLRGL
ncbi:MAG: hypothetical protein V2I33_17590 [Kangiellaceae bacterium]|jgi:hypothetical protein|nr:hypothetical protein [Kangiellaceae bacterium]